MVHFEKIQLRRLRGPGAFCSWNRAWALSDHVRRQYLRETSEVGVGAVHRFGIADLHCSSEPGARLHHRGENRLLLFREGRSGVVPRRG